MFALTANCHAFDDVNYTVIDILERLPPCSSDFPAPARRTRARF